MSHAEPAAKSSEPRTTRSTAGSAGRGNDQPRKPAATAQPAAPEKAEPDEPRDAEPASPAVTAPAEPDVRAPAEPAPVNDASAQGQANSGSNASSASTGNSSSNANSAAESNSSSNANSAAESNSSSNGNASEGKSGSSAKAGHQRYPNPQAIAQTQPNDPAPDLFSGPTTRQSAKATGTSTARDDAQPRAPDDDRADAEPPGGTSPAAPSPCSPPASSLTAASVGGIGGLRNAHAILPSTPDLSDTAAFFVAQRDIGSEISTRSAETTASPD